MADRLPLTLRAYRLATRMASPLSPLLLSYRLRRGKEDGSRLGERRGVTNHARPDGALVWLHGASVGELNAVAPMIDRLRARGCKVLVTSGTVTSAVVAERRFPADVIHQFVPLDVPAFVERFLDHWRPSLALFVESDLWPNLVLAAAERDIPLILLNARLSERSYRRWQRTPATMAAMLARFDLCLAQSSDDATRYGALGAPRISTTGNLKLDVPAPGADATELRRLEQAMAGRPVIAAASTHPGEEAILFEAHRRLRSSFPDLLLLVAPRHPERGEGIVAIAEAAGLRAALRSKGEMPGSDTSIYVADTLGELGLVYRLAPIVFMGGSLVGHGGQNPIEAVRLGAAVLHGPHVFNFADIYAALDKAGGAVQAEDAARLVASIGAWLSDDDARGEAAERGSRALDTMVGALDRTLAALDPYLIQLRLQPRDGHA